MFQCVLRRTDVMQQSLLDRKRYWRRRRHLICKFSLHLRKKKLASISSYGVAAIGACFE
ncbi:hypothetical protein KI387_013479, partial [Taxus chinensis]